MKNNMQPSLKTKKKSLGSFKKILVFLFFFLFIFGSLLAPVKPVKAQFVVTDIPKLVWDKVQDVVKTLWQKGGSLAFQQTLRSALNKMAYDTANWIGSGGEGQKPLFVTQGWGDYMAQIGDEAAGTFLENFTANWSQSREGGTGMTINYCQPSSLDVRLKIALGLSQQQRPRGPSCTATEMIGNWTSAAEKYKSYEAEDFLDKFVNVFDPVSSEMGIYWEASTDMMREKAEGEKEAETTLLGKGGWLDRLTINNEPISLPNQAELEIKGQYNTYSSNFNKYTGDAFVDAANIFLNQLAISSFNKLVQNIGKKTGGSSVSSSLLSDFEADPNVSGGKSALKENTVKLIQPDFGVKADYSILSELSICPDPQNPGPSNCVIDNKFMQAISEQKTVAEALQEGYLNGSWKFEINGLPGSYQNSYSWRNISILRKYRIVPVTWEEVFVKLDQYRRAAEEDVDGEAEIKRASLKDLVSCFSPYDEYNEFSGDFDADDQAWCTGLIDPSWVLKSPLNYCKKLGYSSQIINKYVIPSQPAYGSSPYIPSSVIITRADNYCADNQTCIKEAGDGSCIAYGYCNEEKRTWSFDTETCEPIDNTCQAFISPNSGEEVAYLENTLDYEGCSADNAGCKQYSTYGSYNLNLGTVSWNSNDSLYLNEKTAECSSRDEGCSEFIRVKPAWGANLVMNSNFANDNIGASSTSAFLNEWPIRASYAEIVESNQAVGSGYGKAIKLEGTNRALLYSNTENSLLPDDFDLISGQAYTVSADVYLESGSRAVIALDDDNLDLTYETQATGAWRHISVTKTTNDGFTEPEFSIAGYGGQVVVYIKNIKFEMAAWDTGYTSYASNKSYQKLLPEYLQDTCYVGRTADGYSYQFKDNAPSQCYNYSRQCDRGEVGCELYTEIDSGLNIPAKVASTDYCSEDCLGYDIYIARESNFFSTQAENLIPNTATTCNAESVGCTEFTNLNDLSSGGENKEYYSALKYCVKPGQAECADFYTWEKTTSGSQLKLYSLQAGVGGAPATISDDSGECNSEIYNASINSPLYNPDCREFYNTAGQVFYHLNSKVVTCSDDCRPYRMTEKNYDTTLSEAECSGASRNWDDQEGACVSCLNGGTWSTEHNSCLYQGIPGEGKTCQAAENSCREYNGSMGNNVRLVASYDFESLSPLWTSNCSDGISLADISNDRDGKSLSYNDSASSCSEIGVNNKTLAANFPLISKIIAGDNVAAQLRLGSSVNEGQAYNVKFWASSNRGANLKMYFYNPETKARADFNAGNSLSISSGDGWQIYSINLEELDHEVSGDEILVITADNDFYLDNFILTEITDRYYLIKSSSEIPSVCYYDIFDKYQGADYNLGCSAYVDRAGARHTLHNFSNICASSAVGCEQVISTNNYSPYGGNIWGDDNENGICDSSELDCVLVPKDSATYLVYDSSKQCSQQNLGCSRLGEAVAGTEGSSWSDVFKKNNPNQYDQILCEEESLGCDKWQNADGGGLSYFRDPGLDTCVYRTGSQSLSGQKAWYKSAVKRCDLNANGVIDGGEMSGAVCSNNNDCSGSSCITDSNDYLCEVSYLDTIGYGGDGSQIPVPSDTAGICNPKASSCTEYIDPVSTFNPDLLRDDASDQITLKSNTLYILTVKDDNATTASGATLSFTSPVAILQPDNTFEEGYSSVSIGGSSLAVIFNSLDAKSTELNGNKADVALREAAIAYQLDAQVDKSSCNGLVDFNDGCILFNERGISGASGYNSLSNGFDPYLSGNNNSPVNCNLSTDGSCASNQLVKVRPDRVCATWFDCSTYSIDEVTGEKVCYDLKQCNSLSEDGECNNFIANDYLPKTSNASGYYFLGQYSVSEMSETGLNTNAHYNFEELVPSLYCVRKVVEEDDDENLPCSYDNNIVKDFIIREPDKARVDYPAAGKSYLRVPSAYKISPMAYNSFINLSPNQEYYLSYLVNTKNSSGEAVIEIQSSQSSKNFERKIVTTSSAPHGWERKIYKFSTGTTGYFDRVSLYLTSVGDSQGEVYFDDINIEPVLKMSDTNYAARACRIYPNSDSLDCRDYNQDIISEGLEGYCLEYDKDNKDVCLTWYPVDRISSSLGGTALGYSGKNGLNYCTTVNSNIKFAKKAATSLIAFNIDESKGDFWSSITNSGRCPDGWDDYDNLYSICFYCHPEYNMTTTTAQRCIDDFGLDVNECTSCRNEAGYAGYIQADSDVCMELNAHTYCGNSEYYRAIGINNKMNWNHESVYCVPNDRSDKFIFGVGKKISARMLTDGVPNVSSCDNLTFYKEAWMEYDGELIQEPVIECQKREDINKICEPIDEATNAEPPIRIYNPDYPTYDEQGLNFLAADKGDRDKVFNFSCHEFTQMVSSSGDNKAWTVRTSSEVDPDFAFETPDFFDNTTADLQKYGRQRNSIPYGAATFDATFDLLNSGPVYFQNQYYQKDDTDIYAGRPYGCVGSSCANVGYCSENPNVICVYYPDNNPDPNSYHYINTKTCSDGGYGVCQRLWTNNVGTIANPQGVDATNVLTNIFRQSYGSFKFHNGNYIPGTSGLSSSIPSDGPYIRNPRLFLNNLEYSTINFIEPAGVYTLKFNTTVNPERQPLNMVYINWGDDSSQAITGLDHRPDADNPHIFYHYYSAADVGSEIEIRAWDNWGGNRRIEYTP